MSDTERTKALNDLEVPEDYSGPSLADFPIETVVDFITARRSLHGVVGNTIRDDLSLVGRAFKLAGYRDDENPVYEARRLQLWPVKQKSDHGEFFTPEEFGRDVLAPILASGLPECQFHHDVLLLLAVTGLRNAELDRLRPMDIKFEDGDKGGTLNVNSSEAGRARLRCHADLLRLRC